MYKIIRPFLFLFKPEYIHDKLIWFLSLIYRYIFPLRWVVRKIYCRKHNPVTIKDIKFKNRIGLAAGFDKGAECFDELADFGFGFIELGTVTPFYLIGNDRPRIFRLPKCESILHRTGFNNPGMDVFSRNLKRRRKSYILGVNINKEPVFMGQFAVDDFNDLFTNLYDKVEFFTINSASLDADLLGRVLVSIDDIRKKQTKRNLIFLKLPADIKEEDLKNVIRIAYDNNVDGFIATGPSGDHSLIQGYSDGQLEKLGAGVLSGKIIFQKSLSVVKKIRELDPSKFFTIIGSGGIMNADDAKMMIDAGADLVQIYSAMIYSGPGEIPRMAKKI